LSAKRPTDINNVYEWKRFSNYQAAADFRGGAGHFDPVLAEHCEYVNSRGKDLNRAQWFDRLIRGDQA
jgi:hypothetical protein